MGRRESSSTGFQTGCTKVKKILFSHIFCFTNVNLIFRNFQRRSSRASRPSGSHLTGINYSTPLSTIPWYAIHLFPKYFFQIRKHKNKQVGRVSFSEYGVGSSSSSSSPSSSSSDDLMMPPSLAGAPPSYPSRREIRYPKVRTQCIFPQKKSFFPLGTDVCVYIQRKQKILLARSALFLS